MLNIIGLVVLVVIAVLLIMKEPKLDYTKDKNMLLWYNGEDHNRKFIRLW